MIDNADNKTRDMFSAADMGGDDSAETYERGLSDDDLVRAISDELDNATDEEVDSNREEAMNYYWSRLPAAKGVKGRSKVVSSDVMDAVEATMAELVPAIGSQQLAQFPPTGPEDEQQADVESRIVNHVIMGVGGGFMAITQAIKDGLQRRLSVCKVYWDERTEVAYETHRDVQLEQIPMLLQPSQEGEEVTLAGADYEEQTTLIDGQQVGQIVNGSITIKRTRKVRRPRIVAVPCDELIVNADHGSLDYDSARLVAHQRVVSASELVAMGHERSVVDSLPSYDTETGNTGKTSRVRSQNELDYETGDKSTRPILYTEAYYRIDRDGDGIAELLKVELAGESGSMVLLADEPWDTQPFAVGSPYVVPFSWQGLSLYDRLRFVQDVKTDLIRQMLDTGSRNLNQRIGVIERQVNYNDLATSVLGGMVRMLSPGAVQALPDVQMPQTSFALLEMTDKMRREKGGAAIDTAGQAQQVAHDTAHGLERTMTAIEQVNAMVARNLSETLIATVYRKMHRLLRRYWPGVIQARVGGQWRSQVPSYWPERDEVAVQVGMTTGERMRQMQVLGQVIAQQLQSLQSGQDGILVALPQLYNSLIDFARAGGLQAPEQYWIDPNSPQSQQAAQQKAQAAQQAQQAQAQQAAQIAAAQAQLLKDLEGIKAQSSIAKSQIDARVQLDKLDKDSEAKFAELRLRLAELNAKYDGQPVPDTMAQMEQINDEAAMASAMEGAALGYQRTVDGPGGMEGLQ